MSCFQEKLETMESLSRERGWHGQTWSYRKARHMRGRVSAVQGDLGLERKDLWDRWATEPRGIVGLTSTCRKKSVKDGRLWMC